MARRTRLPDDIRRANKTALANGGQGRQTSGPRLLGGTDRERVIRLLPSLFVPRLKAARTMCDLARLSLMPGGECRDLTRALLKLHGVAVHQKEDALFGDLLVFAKQQH